MNTHSEKAPRVPRKRALLGAVAGVAIGVGAFAGSASAAISTPTTGQNVADGGTVNVTGTIPGVATHYAVATCDISVPADIGLRCNHEDTDRYTAVNSGSPYNETITVDQTFANWNFRTNSAGSGSTLCLNAAANNGGVQCGVVVSYYVMTGSGPVPSGAPEWVAIDIG